MQTMRWNWWWMPLEWTSIRCLCWYKTVRLLFKGPCLIDFDDKRRWIVTENHCHQHQCGWRYWSSRFYLIFGRQKKSKIFFSKVPKLTCAHPNNKESDCKKSSCECDLEYVTSVVQSVKADLYNIKYSRTKLDFEVKMDNPKTNGFAAYFNLECLCKW